MLYVLILASIFGLIVLFSVCVMIKDYFDEKRFQKILKTHPELQKSYNGYCTMKKFHKKYLEQNVVPREKRLIELMGQYGAETDEAKKKELSAQITRAKYWIQTLKTKNDKYNNYREYAQDFWKLAADLSPITFKFLKRFCRQEDHFYEDI